MKKKIVSVLAVSAIALGTVSPAFADVPVDSVESKWGKPTLVYGESLSDVQVVSVNEALGVTDTNTVVRQVATGEEMEKYLGITSRPAMYSSVLVTKKGKGSGVQVTIKTPENIQSVTPNQYANAAITAGVSDVSIEVASPLPVTGESALTGVYKALSANGKKLDTERTLVAQEEVSVVKQITEENAVKKDFDSTLLDGVLAEIKVRLHDYKKENGEVASEAIVAGIVNDALARHGLDGVVTPEQVAQLVSFASKYQNTSAIDSKEVLNQLGDLQDNIKSGVSKVLESANEHGVWEKASSFFASIWESISSLWK